MKQHEYPVKISMMKAAVVIPPVEDFYFTDHRFASLGALKAAEIIENCGRIHTEIINLPISGRRKQIPLPGYLSYLKDYMIQGETGSCSFFSTFRRFGPSAGKCCEAIEKIMPDAVFFSLFAYCYAEPVVELAAELKKRNPGLRLIAGGAGVSVNPDYFTPYFDAVLPGEGETVIREFFNSLNSSFKSQDRDKDSGRDKGNLLTDAVYKNIYTAPHTEEGDFGLSVNAAKSDRSSVNISALLSRGCNKRCRFCSNFITHGRDFRKVPPESVIQELNNKEEIFSRHRGKKFFINFEDDNLLTDKSYFFSILDIFTDFFSKFTETEKILYSAENGLDYNLLSTDLCGQLIDRNFRQFNFTLGSVSPDVIGGEKRKGSSSHLSELLNYLYKRSVPAVSYFIAGLKNDTPEKVIDSLLFIAENPGIAGISMFYSVPGLPDFSSREIFNDIPPGLLRGSSAYPWNSSLTTEQLITAFRLSRTVNLYKKKQLTGSDSELAERIIKERKLYTAARKNRKAVITRAPGINRKMEELFFEKFSPCIS